MDSPPGLIGLVDLLERSDDRAEVANCALRIARALASASPDDLRLLRERVLAAMERFGGSSDAVDAFRLGTLVMTLDRIPVERDIAEWQCPRCRRRAKSLHVMLRPLNRVFERRVCTRCFERPAEGWQRVATHLVDLRCHSCFQHAKPTHVIALVPSPLDATACDDCADDLVALGWRAAVTRSLV